MRYLYALVNLDRFLPAARKAHSKQKDLELRISLYGNVDKKVRDSIAKRNQTELHHLDAHTLAGTV